MFEGSNCGTNYAGESRHDFVETTPSGNYELTFKSGMKYHGKGLEGRMNQSAKERADLNNDPVAKKVFTPADNETAAFVEEARRIARDGGINGGKLYNQINSPGVNKAQ